MPGLREDLPAAFELLLRVRHAPNHHDDGGELIVQGYYCFGAGAGAADGFGVGLVPAGATAAAAAGVAGAVVI